MGTALARRTWRRAELVARFRHEAAALIPYLRGRPRWVVIAGWFALSMAAAASLGAFLVIAWGAARYGGSSLPGRKHQ